MQEFQKVAGLFAASAILIGAIVGCSLGSEATVSGEVTLDGVPIQNGTISFIPADGETATAGGRIEDGTYSVVVPPGPKRVEISATKVVGQRPAYEGAPDSPMVERRESIIPERYNVQSDLTLDVQSGRNVQNFALES